MKILSTKLVHLQDANYQFEMKRQSRNIEKINIAKLNSVVGICFQIDYIISFYAY